MSDGEGDSTTTVPVPPPVARGWRRPLVLILVMAALAGGVLYFGQPRDAFTDEPVGYEVQLAPGERVVIGLAMPSRDVHVFDVRPIVSDGIPVEVMVRRCVLTHRALGSVKNDELTEVCAVPPPVEGLPTSAVAEPGLLDEATGSLEAAPEVPGEGDVQLVVVIEPLEEGTVTIEDVELTHANGPFHRTERIGPTIRVESDPAFAG